MDKDAWFGHTIRFFLLDPRQDTLRLVLCFLIPDLELRSAVRRLTNTCTEASITRGWCLWLFPHKVLKDAMERKLNKFCCSRSQEPIVCVQKELCIIAVHFRVFNVCGLRSSLFTGTASLACTSAAINSTYLRRLLWLWMRVRTGGHGRMHGWCTDVGIVTLHTALHSVPLQVHDMTYWHTDKSEAAQREATVQFLTFQPVELWKIDQDSRLKC